VPDSPEVSVVIATKNRRDRIGPTLTGVLAQEGVELEVIVVDDGSTDGTFESLSALGDPRIRPLRNEQSLGAAGARNRGFEHARGVWTAFLDDDDLWAPQKLRAQLDAAERLNASVAYSSAVVIDASYRPIAVQNAPPAAEMKRDVLRRMAVPGGCSNLIAKSDLVRSCGGFNTNLAVAADWDHWTRLILAGTPADVQDHHIGYVVHDSNMTITMTDLHVEEFAYIDRTYDEYRSREGVRIDGLTFSRWLAGSYRRGGNPRSAIKTYLRGAWRYRSPGNVTRALGTVLGERAMRLGRSFAPHDDGAVEEPDWLQLYRPGGPLHQPALVPDPDAS
jgi:glycosyltransferase involved in cell wall biosynthesis